MHRLIKMVVAIALLHNLAHLAFAGPDRSARGGRLAQLDDFLALEEFGLVRPSPDGRLLAVEIRRARAGERFTGSMNLFARSDIWIVDIETRQATRITDGSVDGSWSWSPVWSPSGRRLALLAGSPDGHVRLALWEPGARGLHRLDELSVDLEANFGALTPYPPHGRRAVAWLDDRRLLTVLLPEGAYNHEIALSNARLIRGGQWERTERGEVAATVWDSRAVPVCNPESALVMIDIDGGGAATLMTGALRGVSLSPDGRHAAVIRAVAPQKPKYEEPVEFPLAWSEYADSHVATDLVLIDLTDEAAANRVDGVAGLNYLSRRQLPRWSQDSRRLAIPARSAAGEDRSYLVSGKGLDVASFGTRSPLEAEFLAELLAMAARPEASVSASAQRLRLRDDTALGNVDFSIGGVGGGEIIRLAGSRIAVLVDGLITVVGDDGHVRFAVPAPAGSLVHPHSGNRRPASSLIFDAGAKFSRVRFDPEGGHIDTIPKPNPAAHLVAVVGEDGPFVMVADRDDGSYLWLMESSGEIGEPVIVRNTHLREVAPPRQRILEYELPDGEPRRGLLLLPPGFEAGRRYPAAVHVYPGVVISDDRLSQSVLNRYSSYPLTLLAAAGYVVFYPDIPVPRGDDAPLEILSLIAGHVLAAANALVDQGYADPSRLGVYGHSYGGYATLAIATQTDRFRVAVASAAPTDLIAHHDSVWHDFEMLACGPSIARMAAAELESRQAILRMRAPPLAAPERYLRNSPYFRLDGMTTPLLLLHGELDPISAAGAERVFVALDRLGAPVRFARYWGEGHNLRSSGNIRHSWSETLHWFDTFLRDMPPER